MTQHIETVIIGGGQAGLAVSYHLKQKGADHIILERSSRPAHTWRSDRWDSFTLVTPNWTLYKMPGSEENVQEPNGFMERDRIADFFDGYVVKNELSVKYNTEVLSVEAAEKKTFLVRTSEMEYRAKNVVVATGFCQMPKIPSFAKNISGGIRQLHSSRYRNPEDIPAGAVLVTGSGQSGCQIAEEIHLSGKKVFLSTGTAGRVPRRYRGRDIIEWLVATGFFNMRYEQLPPGSRKFHPIPHLSGTMGGHSLNLHKFAADGVTLLGHMTGADNYKITFASDLYANLQASDQMEAMVTGMIDAYIQANGIDAPPEELPNSKTGFGQPLIEELDLKAENIKTIIWAGGYSYDYSLIKIPVFDQDSYPVQEKGVTEFPGLFFVGMPWMPSQSSGNLVGMVETAEHVASHILTKTEKAIA